MDEHLLIYTYSRSSSFECQQRGHYDMIINKIPGGGGGGGSGGGGGGNVI